MYVIYLNLDVFKQTETNVTNEPDSFSRFFSSRTYKEQKCELYRRELEVEVFLKQPSRPPWGTGTHL